MLPTWVSRFLSVLMRMMAGKCSFVGLMRIEDAISAVTSSVLAICQSDSLQFFKWMSFISKSFNVIQQCFCLQTKTWILFQLNLNITVCDGESKLYVFEEFYSQNSWYFHQIATLMNFNDLFIYHTYENLTRCDDPATFQDSLLYNPKHSFRHLISYSVSLLYWLKVLLTFINFSQVLNNVHTVASKSSTNSTFILYVFSLYI